MRVNFALVAALLAAPAAFADESAPAPTPAPAAEAPKTVETPKPAPHVLPTTLEDLVKMSEAGVSQEIILKFLETNPEVAAPTAQDVIAMKERKLPDPVIATVILRAADERRRVSVQRSTIAAPAIVRSLATDGEMDPESYEFFWYHHAYPRALASSYETLAPYNPYVAPNYGNGYYGGQGPVFYRRNPIPWRTSGFSKDSFVPSRNGKSRTSSGKR